jgi:phage/conjugal plasmid C-4 type zinc finger TraR family protein
MNQISNADRELADRRAEEERLAALNRVQLAARGQLVTAQRFYCRDCGEPIGAARREALPAAEDCIDCATFLERNFRRRA